MRKLFATIALCIILIGTFAPVSISVSQIFNLNTDTDIITQGDSGIISIQRAFAEGPTPPAEAPPAETQTDVECGGTDFFCMLFKFFLTFFLFIPNTIATISGLLMDVSLKVSISPAMYGVGTDTIAETIRTAWTIIRDFTNIAFIFALFVSAFSLIAGRDFLGDPKKTVVKVIIMALLVNFSLLFCRIIIQSADVFSNLLYNRIALDSGKRSDGSADNSFSVDKLLGDSKVKSASLAIISKVNPQSVLISGSTDYNTTSFIGLQKKTWQFYIDYGIVALIVFFIYLILTSLFLGMLFIFLGRIIGLWIGMILSPIAFVSYTIPFIEKDQYIGFENWLKNFVELSFTTPVFLFFLYLAITVLKLNTIVPDEIRNNSGTIASLITMLLPLFAATFILMQGKKISTKMAGIVGELAGKVSGMVSTAALGAATGGTAMLARQTVGRAGAAIGNSSVLMNTQAKGGALGWGAGILRSGGKGLGVTSFDVRNNSRAMEMFGKATGTMGEKIDLGSKFMNTGGYKAEGAIGDMPGKYFKQVSEKAQARKQAETEALLADIKEKQAKSESAVQSKIDQENAKLTNETGKIKTEAENQSVNKIIDQSRLNLAGINQVITDINKKITTNGFNQADHTSAKIAKDTADKELAQVEKDIQDNEEKIKKGDMAALTKRSTLNKEKQDKLTKQQIATNAFNDQELKKQAHEKLENERNQEESNKKNEEGKINKFGKYVNKTIDQTRKELEIKKLEAENTAEGIAVKESKEQEKKHSEKLKELAQKRKKAKEDGDLAEIDALDEKIKKEKDDLVATKAKTKNAQTAFDNLHDFKAIENEVNALEKDYVKSQQSRLKRFQDSLHSLNIDLKTQQIQGQSEQKKIMETFATNYDDAGNRGATARTTSNVVGIITGGRAGGSNLNNNSANISAANSARNNARKK